MHRNHEEGVVSAEFPCRIQERRLEIRCCSRAWLGAQVFMLLLLLSPIGILVLLGPATRLSQVQGQLREPRVGALLGPSLGTSMTCLLGGGNGGCQGQRGLGAEEVVLWQEPLLFMLLGAFEA